MGKKGRKAPFSLVYYFPSFIPSVTSLRWKLEILRTLMAYIFSSEHVKNKWSIEFFRTKRISFADRLLFVFAANPPQINSITCFHCRQKLFSLASIFNFEGKTARYFRLEWSRTANRTMKRPDWHNSWLKFQHANNNNWYQQRPMNSFLYNFWGKISPLTCRNMIFA